MHPVVVWLVSWLVPGAGHLLQGRRQKGVIFLIAIPAMFAIGLARRPAVPVRLHATARRPGGARQLAVGVPYFVASAMQLGQAS